MATVLGLATCYNRKEKTVNAIKKLCSGNPAEHFSFIVVDDNSSDGTYEALAEMEHVTVVRGSGSLFYTGGMRRGIELALNEGNTYDYCLLFNDDVDFLEGSVSNLISYARKDPCIWVGPTCNGNRELTYGGVTKASKWRPTLKKQKADTAEGKVCDTFNANCVLIPWDAFQRLGNMDPVYTHAMGDYDYGFDAARKGITIKVSDFFVGLCENNLTENSWGDVRLSRRERLKKKASPKGLPAKEWFYFLRKNYSLLTAVLYSIVPYVRILIKK